MCVNTLEKMIFNLVLHSFLDDLVFYRKTKKQTDIPFGFNPISDMHQNFIFMHFQISFFFKFNL